MHLPSLRVSILSLALICASLCGPTRAADIFWSITPGVDDSEVITEGDQVFGYYFNPDTTRPLTVNVNGVPFGLVSGTAPPPGLEYNGSYNNPEGVDLYQVPPNGDNNGLAQILDSQTWGSEAPLTLTGLVPDGPYAVQFMISDDRPNFRNLRNYDIDDENGAEGARDIERAYHSTAGGGIPLGAPIGSVEGKIFTGFFIADGPTQDIRNWLYEGTNHLGGNSGSQVNAIQLRTFPIPEPSTITLGAIAFGLFALHRQWAKVRKRKT